MRLRVVEHGHAIGRKLILIIARLMTGYRQPDVVRTLFYKPGFFGDAHSAWTNRVMRGQSPWTVGEREIFAAFTSKINQCEF
jgi:hypothetical protein